MTDELLGRHKAVLPDWLALYYADPMEITHGEGRHVWDAEGNKYLDFFGGILTTIMSVGAITVPAFATNTVDDNRHVLTHSGARGVIISNPGIAKRVLPAAINPPFGRNESGDAAQAARRVRRQEAGGRTSE